MLDRNLVAGTTLFYGANGIYDKFRFRVQTTKDLENWTTVLDLDGMVMSYSLKNALYHDGWYYFSLSCVQDRKYALGSYLIRSQDGVHWSEPIKLGISASTDGNWNNAFLFVGFWGQYICLMSLAGLHIGNMSNIVGNTLPLERKTNMEFHGFYNEIPGCSINMWSYAGQLYVPDATQWTSYANKGTPILPVSGYADTSPVIPANGKLYVAVSKQTYPLPDLRRGQCCLLSSTPALAATTWTIEKTWAYDADPVKQPRMTCMNSATPYNFLGMNAAHHFVQQNGKFMIVTQSDMDSYLGTNLVATADFINFDIIKTWPMLDWADIWVAMGDVGTGVCSYVDHRVTNYVIDTPDYYLPVLDYPFSPK